MLLVEAIDLNLHLGMPVLHQDGKFADQSSRAKPLKENFLRRALGKLKADDEPGDMQPNGVFIGYALAL